MQDVVELQLAAHEAEKWGCFRGFGGERNRASGEAVGRMERGALCSPRAGDATRHQVAEMQRSAIRTANETQEIERLRVVGFADGAAWLVPCDEGCEEFLRGRAPQLTSCGSAVNRTCRSRSRCTQCTLARSSFRMFRVFVVAS